MLTKCHINEAKIIYQPQRLVLEQERSSHVTLAQMDLWTWCDVQHGPLLCSWTRQRNTWMCLKTYHCCCWGVEML